MRKIITLGLILLSSISITAQAKPNTDPQANYPYSFTISKKVYSFSEIYQIQSAHKETYPGTIKKSAFRIRTNYDLSNNDGWQATGITRALSLGSIYPWAVDIDIYDTRDVQIGLIDGNVATLESAKYNLYEYDDAGNSTEVGIAYANVDFTHFAIHPSLTDPRLLAELNRNFADKTWTVTVYSPESIDERILRIFAGFVIDYEDKFIDTSSDTDVS